MLNEDEEKSYITYDTYDTDHPNNQQNSMENNQLEAKNDKITKSGDQHCNTCE